MCRLVLDIGQHIDPYVINGNAKADVYLNLMRLYIGDIFLGQWIERRGTVGSGHLT